MHIILKTYTYIHSNYIHNTYNETRFCQNRFEEALTVFDIHFTIVYQDYYREYSRFSKVSNSLLCYLVYVKICTTIMCTYKVSGQKALKESKPSLWGSFHHLPSSFVPIFPLIFFCHLKFSFTWAAFFLSAHESCRFSDVANDKRRRKVLISD